MRKILILVAVFYVANAWGQQPTVDQRKKAAESVYRLYAKYRDDANLQTIARGSGDKYVAEFKSLFAPGATIYDDINPADTMTWDMTRTSRKTVDAYIAAVAYNYKNGLNGSITRANISFDSLAKHIVKIVYERNVNAPNYDGYKFSDQDTMVLRIFLSDDFSDAYILSVEHLGGQLKCQFCPSAAAAALAAADAATAKTDKKVDKKADADNPPKPVETKKAEAKPVAPGKPKPVEVKKPEKTRCPDDDDCDGVPNLVDNCPEAAGPASNHGCPVQTVAVGLSINVGGGAGVASMNSASPNNAYDPHGNYYTVSAPNAAQVKFNMNAGGGYSAGLDIDLLFGEKKNVGISIGLNVLQDFLTANVPNSNPFMVIYQVQSDGDGDPYTRILSASDFSEKLTFTHITLPILFKYQTSPDKKIGFNIEVGPVVSLSSWATSQTSANLNFGAVYAINPPGTNPPLTYAGTSPPASGQGYWELTQSYIGNHLPPGQTVDQVLSSYYAEGRYVGSFNNYSGSRNKVSYNIGYGGLLRLGGVYRFTPHVSLLFGVYADLLYDGHNENSAYQPITISDPKGDFQKGLTSQSFLNGIGGALTTQIGVNLGIQVRFGKKKD